MAQQMNANAIAAAGSGTAHASLVTPETTDCKKANKLDCHGVKAAPCIFHAALQKHDRNAPTQHAS
jgi:hypothetical protein